MLDVIYNKLKASNDLSMSEWKDVDPTIFNKHVQYTHETGIKKNDILKELKIEPTIDVCEVCEVAIKKDKVLHKNTPIISKNKKDETIKPLDVIIKETMSFDNSTKYIKDVLITLISKEEFTKIFGLTKCAEIMSGIVNNRWNKSTALFISFLLDKEIYYNEKVVLYNKEKNIGRITIAKI
jgi:hypothetical protein|uniref:Uncharacterized protein n=1 Tax=viral metagenome TaxID=1070528 RepID=A0A6C0LXM4_9ZZZZ